MRQWRAKAGLSAELPLQDARGTVSKRFLRAGCSIKHIAAHMGPSLRYAANVIEDCAAVSLDEPDEIFTILAAARGAEQGKCSPLCERHNKGDRPDHASH